MTGLLSFQWRSVPFRLLFAFIVVFSSLSATDSFVLQICIAYSLARLVLLFGIAHQRCVLEAAELGR